MSLPQLRQQIDRLDRQLLRLLNQRARLALRVGMLKQRAHQAVFNPKREQAILRSILRTNHGPLTDRQVRELFRVILTHSRTLQSRKRTR